MTGADGGARARGEASLPLAVAFGLVACLLYGLGGGLRSDIGILLQPLASQCGAEYADVSLCVAVMQVVFGAAQPVFGVVASRRSNRFVLVLGACLLGASLVGMAFSRSLAALMLFLGVLFGLGAGALAFGLVLTSAIRFVGPRRAMLVSGMLNAAAGLGSFALSPALQALLSSGGAQGALLGMLVPVAALVPAALVVTSRDPKPGRGAKRAGCPDGGPARGGSSGAPSGEGAQAAGEGGAPDTLVVQPEGAHAAGESAVPAAPSKPGLPFREALGNRTFRLLVAGFTTCGFHMVIIESHLYNQFVLEGIEPQSAAWAFSIYGVATIVGALLSGWLSARAPKGRLLAAYYGFRAAWVALFVFVLPMSLPLAVVFSVGLGMTGDATVSPTSGLVSEQFSLEHVATLVGVLFLCHQVGAFFSAWLGGALLGLTGGYQAVWAIDVALCAFASLMSARIGRGARA